MAKPEYRLSPRALEDMESVWLYSMSQWGLDQATMYIDDLATTFNFLATNPKSGKDCSNIRVGYRKHPTLKHIIYYRITGYGIEVIRVLHDHQLASRYL